MSKKLGGGTQLGQMTQIGQRDILCLSATWGTGRRGLDWRREGEGQRYLAQRLFGHQSASSRWPMTPFNYFLFAWFTPFSLFLLPIKLYLCWPMSFLTSSSSHSLPYAITGKLRVIEQQCGGLAAGWSQTTTTAKLFYAFILFLCPFLPGQQPVPQAQSRSLLRGRIEGLHMKSNSLLSSHSIPFM